MIYVKQMNEWECGFYGGVGNLLTLVSFCNKNTGVQVTCGAGYSPENMVVNAVCNLSCVVTGLEPCYKWVVLVSY